MSLLQAAAHRFGPGKIHILIEDGTRTRCGKTREDCPGRIVQGLEADCLVCQRNLRNEQRQAESDREWQERQRRQQLEREEAGRRWWEGYSQYLQTPQWQARRLAVMERDQWLCQGCRQYRATQVHHRTYERVGREMLFDLIAVCDACHRILHPSRGL